jgi:quercetin dioxygenase-like cupin family protein
MSINEVISVGQITIRYLCDGSQEKKMGTFEMIVPPKSNVPPAHSHSNNEELVYVLEGKLRYTVDSETRDLGPGETMSTPMGSTHGFSNPFEIPARVLVVLSPDIGAQYFRDVAAVVNSGGPPDRAKLMQVMASYGLKPAPAVIA